MPITNEFTVTEDDLDLFNHMNYKRYIELFEEERSTWFTTSGLSFKQMVERGISVVILKLNTDYKKEARLGEPLTIKTALGKLGTKSFTMEQTMYNGAHEEIAQSHCTFVMFDLKTRTSIPVVNELRQFFSGTGKEVKEG